MGALASIQSFIQFQSDVLQVPIVGYCSEYNDVYGMTKMVNKSVGLLSKKGLLHQKSVKQVLPNMDPLSCVARYNYWLDTVKKYD